MAEVVLRLAFEREALLDQFAQLSGLREAIAKRHGEQFRDLERRIDLLPEAPLDPDVHYLGEGLFTASIPVIADLLSEGRRLGVI